MEVLFNPVWPWPILFLVALALAALSVWSYLPGLGSRKLLIALRLLAVLLAIAPLLRPSLVFTKKRKQSSVLVVLADKSKSMLLRDMWDDQSRWQAMKRLLAEADPAFKQLAEEVKIRWFSFSGKLSETIGFQEEPAGEQTAIGGAIEEVVQRAGNERLAGILLLSDGANTTGTPPITVARKRPAGYNVPIYAFGFGRETATERVRDVAAKGISASPTVFAKNKMPVRGEFSTAGFGNQSIGVKLLLNGVEKGRAQFTAKEGSDRIGVEMSAVPDTAGDLKLTIEADPQPGELLPSNNAVSTYVTVLAGGISVLEIEGKYRYWEPKFLRWALDQSPDIDLEQRFLLDAAGRAEPLPPDIFKPGKHDVVILGDVASNRIPAEQLAMLARSVTQGTGLLMMGGYESFGPGGWGQTPIADVLPVRMQPGDAQLSGQLKFLPTDAGVRHFILRLAGSAEANAVAWKTLRPMDGGSAFGELKPGALLLAATPENVPLLVAQDVGAGRTIAFAGDTSWRWRRDPAGIAAHARFWRQLILWLAHKEESSGANVKVKLPQRRLAIGQRLPVAVLVEDANGSPLPNPTVQAVVETPNGKTVPVELHRQGDEHVGNFLQTDLDGDYSIKVVATVGDKSVGNRSMKFLVYAEDAEMQQLAADLGTMRGLAQLSDGEYHSPEDLPKFIETLKKKELNLEIAQPEYVSLWDTWGVLTAFFLVVVLEWVLRRRRGMP